MRKEWMLLLAVSCSLAAHCTTSLGTLKYMEYDPGEIRSESPNERVRLITCGEADAPPLNRWNRQLAEKDPEAIGIKNYTIEFSEDNQCFTLEGEAVHP